MHPTAAIANAPADVALSAGYEQTFYEEKNWEHYGSWACMFGASVSRSFPLFGSVDVTPKAGRGVELVRGEQHRNHV